MQDAFRVDEAQGKCDLMDDPHSFPEAKSDTSLLGSYHNHGIGECATIHQLHDDV